MTRNIADWAIVGSAWPTLSVAGMKLSGTIRQPKPRIGYELGENVRVTEGPFTNFTGVIREVYPERGKIRVMVSIFGRATPVELDFLQVERV
jgi:transcriptional antiterminator NusG